MAEVEEAFEQSLSEAVKAGKLDVRKHAAAIAAARKLARSIDDDPEKSANVKFPTMLKYLEALGMLPEYQDEVKRTSKKHDAIIVHGKFSKAAND